MPSARYSLAAIRPKASTSAWSPMAAKPIGSGHRENSRMVNVATDVSVECRGSELNVTGMPRRVRSARRCTALVQRAVSAAPSSPNRLKWVMCLSARATSIGSTFIGSSTPAIPPCGPGTTNVWKSSPAFSLSVIRERRSSTRAATGSRRSS